MTNSVSKVDNEKKTVQIMIKIYCNRNHDTRGILCEECDNLLKYAFERLDNCKFGNNKGTCGRCKIHCYRPDKREQIRRIMRFSGPRMIYTHPILALKHILDVIERK